MFRCRRQTGCGRRRCCRRRAPGTSSGRASGTDPGAQKGPGSGLRDRTSATVSSWPTASRTGCGWRRASHRQDALYGGFLCGGRRAAEFGRAPVIHDTEWAYTLWGYLGDVPEDLVAWRVPLFRGAAEEYWAQRQIVDAVRPETLRLTPAQVRGRLASWKDLVIA